MGYYRKEETNADIRVVLPYVSNLRKEPTLGRARWVTHVDTLHEFGHIAGLRHEHARGEFATDRNCNSPFLDEPLVQESKFRDTKFYSTYDPNSVMNYCFMKIQKLFGPVFEVQTLTEIGQNLPVLSERIWEWSAQSVAAPSELLTFPLIEDPTTGKIDEPEAGRYRVALEARLSQKDQKTLRLLYRKHRR